MRSRRESKLVAALQAARQQGPVEMRAAAEALSEHALKQRDSALHRDALNAIGVSHLMENRFADARSCFLQALSLSRELQDPVNEIGLLSNLGLVHLMQSHYELALNAFLAIRRKIRAEQLEVSEATTLNNLAIAYHYLERYEEAAEAYRQSAKLAEAEGEPLEEGKTRLNLAQSLIRAGKLEEAEAACQRADQLLEATAPPPVKGTLLTTLGLLRLKQGRVDEALKVTVQGQKLVESGGNDLERLGVLVTMGECHEHLGQHREAEQHYRAALRIADDNHRVKDGLECCEYLARLYHESGQLERAVTYYADAQKRCRLLFTSEAARMRSEAQVRHETELMMIEQRRS